MISCQNDLFYQEITKESSVIIGNISRDYSIIKLSPEKQISMPGKDSLDLDSDGKSDIVFIKAIIPTVTDIGSETRISTGNNLQILLDNLYNCPDTLNINTVLNFRAHWSDSKPYSYILYSYACYSYFHCLRYGNFGQVSEKYIGFKLGRKFGWILIDNTPDLLLIKEYTEIKNNHQRPDNNRLDANQH